MCFRGVQHHEPGLPRVKNAAFPELSGGAPGARRRIAPAAPRWRGTPAIVRSLTPSEQPFRWWANRGKK